MVCPNGKRFFLKRNILSTGRCCRSCKNYCESHFWNSQFILGCFLQPFLRVRD